MLSVRWLNPRGRQYTTLGISGVVWVREQRQYTTLGISGVRWVREQRQYTTLGITGVRWVREQRQYTTLGWCLSGSRDSTLHWGGVGQGAETVHYTGYHWGAVGQGAETVHYTGVRWVREQRQYTTLSVDNL